MEVVVAAISGGIALLALVVSIVVARRQTAIQERVAAIEEARRAEEVEARGRARVTAGIVYVDARPAMAAVTYPPPDRLLMLRNEGPALARDVALQLEEGPGVPLIRDIQVLPADLQPGQYMGFPIPVKPEDDAMVRVTVCWTDGAGDHEEPFTLQLY